MSRKSLLRVLPLGAAALLTLSACSSVSAVGPKAVDEEIAPTATSLAASQLPSEMTCTSGLTVTPATYTPGSWGPIGLIFQMSGFVPAEPIALNVQGRTANGQVLPGQALVVYADSLGNLNSGWTPPIAPQAPVGGYPQYVAWAITTNPPTPADLIASCPIQLTPASSSTTTAP